MDIARFALVSLASLSFGAAACGQQPLHDSATTANTPWVQLAKLTPSSYAYWNGNSVAISGNVIAVGAPYSQLVSVYVMPSGGWGNMVETARLTASDAPLCGIFGSSVAMSGHTIVVGDPQTNCYSGQQGAAYVFVEPAGGWSGTLTQTAELTASDAVAGDQIGYSVGINGNSVVAGAPSQSNAYGAAYVFSKPSNGWANATQTAKLTASDGQASEQFGISVAATSDVIVAGCPYTAIGTNQAQGAAYVYVKPAGGWANATQTAKLTASQGQQYDDLGSSVSVSGPVVAAGAPAFYDSPGAVYVFVEPPGGWLNTTQAAKLTAVGGNVGDGLGASVATDGALVVSGAPNYSNSPNELQSRFFREGAAYVFVKPAGGWTSEAQAAKLTGSDARFGAELGRSVAVGTKTAVAGGLFNNRNVGAAYVFSAFAGQ